MNIGMLWFDNDTKVDFFTRNRTRCALLQAEIREKSDGLLRASQYDSPTGRIRKLLSSEKRQY